MENQGPEENFEEQEHSMLHKRAQMRTRLSKGVKENPGSIWKQMSTVSKISYTSKCFVNYYLYSLNALWGYFAMIMPI